LEYLRGYRPQKTPAQTGQSRAHWRHLGQLERNRARSLWMASSSWRVRCTISAPEDRRAPVLVAGSGGSRSARSTSGTSPRSG